MAKDEDDDLEGIAKATDEAWSDVEIPQEFIARVVEEHGVTHAVAVRQIQEWLCTQEAADFFITQIMEQLQDPDQPKP